MKNQRAQILEERRLAAGKKAFQSLKASVAYSDLVLSYSGIDSELSLDDLNQWLYRQKSLVLPRVEGKALQLYLITQSSQLIKSSWGILEPDPDTSVQVDPHDLSLALIPGLAFDSGNHRLGYGKGYYDRLLSLCKTSLMTIGIGFHEQLVKPMLPSESHDVPLRSISLF